MIRLVPAGDTVRRSVWNATFLLLMLASLSAPVTAAPFTFTNYDQMVAELESLATAFPGLADHFTAQERFGLPTLSDGNRNDLAQHVLRITNESLGFDKPEVLLIGVQHGDEVVSLEVALVLARLLLEQHGQDPWLTALVDRREIFIMPLANPVGFNRGVRSSPGAEGTEDMNRDHIYDRDPCTAGCQDADSLSTVGARAIHELARRHLFRVVLDYHGGIELILHPWGTPRHNSNTQSPDFVASNQLGLRFRNFGGPFNGLTPVGTSTDLLGALFGPLDDTAYAASWDSANADPLFPTEGNRALSYTIEISNQKRPPQSTLGGDASLLTSGGVEDGYVPKNVRVGLAAIDIAEPWVEWTNRDQIPSQVSLGSPVRVTWRVRGCFDVDDTHVRFGVDPDPRQVFSGQSASQQQTTGDPCFETPTTFSALVTFPNAGTFHLTPVARVDGGLLAQPNPNPVVSAQSLVVRARNEEGLLVQNIVDPAEVNTVVGQLFWGAEPVAIEVVDDGGGGDPTECLTVDFEAGAPGWTSSGLWHLAANSTCPSPQPGFSSPVTAQYFGQDASCDYSTGATVEGSLTSPTVNGITAQSTLSFQYLRQVESFAGGSFDQTRVEIVSAGSSTQIFALDSTDASSAVWTSSGDLSLAAFAGQAIQVRFAFDSVDGQFNGFLGWFVDDVVVIGDCGDPGNTAPQVTIAAPTDDTTVIQGSSVAFLGMAADAEDGDLTSSLAWSSDLDGTIGNGGSFATSALSVGLHTITASVADADGLAAAASIRLRVEADTGPPPPAIDWTTTPTVAYSNQDGGGGQVIVEDLGATIMLSSNRWRRTIETFDITPSTVIELEFQSTAQGEIHGIGLDQDDTLTNGLRIFQLFGTQTWGGAHQQFNGSYTTLGSFVTYRIPVGTFYTGTGFRLVLVNDKDAGAQTNTSRFRNVRLIEAAR